MKDQHTPGPWQVFNAGHLGCGVTRRYCGDIAHCHGYDTNRSRAEELANARLIAAAPDMLAALRDLLAEVQAGGYPGRTALEAARAAIAKAAGQ